MVGTETLAYLLAYGSNYGSTDVEVDFTEEAGDY